MKNIKSSDYSQFIFFFFNRFVNVISLFKKFFQFSQLISGIFRIPYFLMILPQYGHINLLSLMFSGNLSTRFLHLPHQYAMYHWCFCKDINFLGDYQ
jgi:hypothetical protein